MSPFLTILLGAVVLLLFYRWVERRHKVVIAKILGVILALAAIGIGWILYRARAQAVADTNRRRAITITYVPDSVRANPLRRYYTERDTITEVSFRICNTGTDTVLKITFYPKTYNAGRSTPHDLRIAARGEYYPSNEFISDFVLTPNSCEVLTWPGRFQVLDSVEAVPVLVDVR